ncbi:Asp-tRNAAsn/Glu-tRNAGln amidotransferase A subunit [Paenibacillus catalpae]|uniref:Asp-tRNAAsn/Glu-tRNAGln amidotransferase A subunit n=1 Tax=Paenibacillus catalpae TaxID=1045775 RepID=A0A1I2E3Q3_9BACL|nr:amidase family protein [Paenibacillus catalpae]SFE87283.1 Asp-tRNAAsn/Glu-tRNAGln amidotransferase A subunit [Paenibacillus catalpae]
MIKPIIKFTSLLLLGSMLIYSTPLLNTTGAYANASTSTSLVQEQTQAQAPNAMVQLSGPALTSVGDSFNVTVSLTGATGDATAGKFIFEYDPAQFDYISAASANSAVSIAGVNAETGKVTIVTTDTTGSLTTVGSILTLTFKANAATDLSGISGTVELGMDDGSTVQTPEESVAVQITDAAQGDLNANSVIDVGDLSVLIKYFGIHSDDPNWPKVANGDFNKDNTIDLQDLASLGKKVLYDNGQPFQLMEADIMSIQNAIAAGKLTSEQLVQMYLDRINEFDDDINSLITINPDALATAKALDDERKEKGPRGLMHGIPIIVKDNYDTIGMPTSAGCTCLKDNQTVSDAFMIKKLKDAGAIILAKANLSEFAINTDTNSSLGGQTKNPYDLTKNPGGSSGGTGASLASNFAVAGLGTDTGGSIRIPSSWNSIVGIRPTIGLTSRDGIIPLALSQDVGGPMARTVSDAAVLLDAVSGYDPNDIVTAGSFGKKPVSYTKYLDKNGLKGARIGLVLDSSVVGTNQEALGLLNNAAQDMRDQGATVIGVNIPSVADIMKYPSLSGYEFKFNLNDYLSNARMVDPAVVRYHSLKDIIDSGSDFLSSLKSTLNTRNNVESLDTQEYKDIVLFRTRTTQQSLLSLMASNDLDAILYLSTTGPAGSSSGNANRLSPFSGFPAISVPAGYVSSGLPVGIELLGRPYEEGELIKLGYAYEQATHHRVAPNSVPALSGK